MSVCEGSSPADEAVLASLSFQFGKLCSGLAGELRRWRGEGGGGAGGGADGCSCCSSGSLQEEQKILLLQRFKLLCLAGLEAEGSPVEGGAESTLVRCNCCYNLPVGGQRSKVRVPGADLTPPCCLMSRPWCCSLRRPTSWRSSTPPSPVCAATRRSACGAASPPVSTRWQHHHT